MLLAPPYFNLSLNLLNDGFHIRMLRIDSCGPAGQTESFSIHIDEI
jgi:hypothetical protein